MLSSKTIAVSGLAAALRCMQQRELHDHRARRVWRPIGGLESEPESADGRRG
jgi:hypothetical protein